MIRKKITGHDEKRTFSIRSKIWIEDQNGNVVFGLGRFRILEAIDRHRSLQAAAKELKMSYRALWGRVKASEQRMGKSLVERHGRGSQLTPFARNLMSQFSNLHTKIISESDTVFTDLLATHFKG